jgi:hypothetical protein
MLLLPADHLAEYRSMENACDPGTRRFIDAYSELISLNSPTFSTLFESNEAVCRLHQFITATSAVHASMKFDEKQQHIYGALDRIDVVPMLLDHASTALQQLQQPILPQPAAHLSVISLICANLSTTLQLQGSTSHTAADSSAGQKSVPRPEGIAAAGGCSGAVMLLLQAVGQKLPCKPTCCNIAVASAFVSQHSFLVASIIKHDFAGHWHMALAFAQANRWVRFQSVQASKQYPWQQHTCH